MIKIGIIGHQFKRFFTPASKVTGLLYQLYSNIIHSNNQTYVIAASNPATEFP
jgi:hypothetical protein